MITIDINKMELPVLDVIQAVPIRIPIKKDFNMYFDIPSVNKYFIFESKYLELIHKYLVLFSKVVFLELEDFSKIDLKKEFIKELKVVMQNMKFIKDFVKIIKEYFTADFDLSKTLDIVNPMQLSYLMLFIHNIVENVKKNWQQVDSRMSNQMSETFSISSKGTSGKIEPRF